MRNTSIALKIQGKKKRKAPADHGIAMKCRRLLSNSYPRSESNRDRQNRNLKFYPLNYGGGVSGHKVNKKAGIRAIF